MKKIIVSAVIFISANVSAQLKSIERINNQIVVNDSIKIDKGSEIQIHLPANKDFMFVRQKKSGLSAKMLGGVADVVGTGASAIGVGTNSIGTMSKALKVVRTARAIEYGADALEKIQNLPISDKAKKIAGKKMKVLDWNFTDDGWVLLAEFEKKKYEIYLQEAIVTEEVKFQIY